LVLPDKAIDNSGTVSGNVVVPKVVGVVIDDEMFIGCPRGPVEERARNQ
jgi:hypothetical protein